MILCARSMSTSSEQSTKRRSHSENMWKVFISRVKITRLYDSQTWQTHFWRNLWGVQRFVGFLSWCCFWMLIDCDNMDIIAHTYLFDVIVRVNLVFRKTVVGDWGIYASGHGLDWSVIGLHTTCITTQSRKERKNGEKKHLCLLFLACPNSSATIFSAYLLR